LAVDPGGIGQPDKITVIFGRKITKQYRGKLQTEIEDMSLPVIRSHYGNGFIKQYVPDHTSSSGRRQRATASTTTASRKPYLNVQQDKALDEFCLPSNWVAALCALPNGCLASGSDDGTIRL
jgi:hypothetical protein